MPSVSANRWRWFLWLGRSLPPQRQRAVPWSGLEIVIDVLIVYVLVPAWVHSLLTASGFYASLFGPGPVQEALEQLPSPEGKLLLLRMQVWARVLAFPLQIAVLLLLLQVMSGTRPYQLGLTWHRGWQNLRLGVVAAIILTPITLAIQYVAVSAFQYWQGTPVEEHPLYSLRTAITGMEWVVLLLQVLVVAPGIEELLFRGLLQRWLCQHEWGGSVAMALSLMVALTTHPEKASQWTELSPALFVVTLMPLFALVVYWSRSPTGPAIFGTAVLFGTVHAAVWPTPIPLFVLGLGLGWLAWRTQSLVAPIVVHMLFNAVGSVGFFFPAQ
jgi:membrane protease YdiL (CAAX protease family)